jgi:CfrBI restriction endonuclease.
MEMKKTTRPSIDNLFPEPGRVLLTGGGKQFVERIGIEAIRHAVHSVMMGENLRTQTEPLSRRRIAQISGALVVLFMRGYLEIDEFTKNISKMALDQITDANKNDRGKIWPAQWLLGLTGKSVQNVLRSKPEATKAYITDFEAAIKEAADRCREEMGDCRLTLGFVEDRKGRRAELDWEGITRLTTAIGSQTLTIRGSDKSIYGKLFERLILGSFLSILGYERVDPHRNTKSSGVFWLSDSSETRECDATLLVQPGKLARFDIGFIGPGNSEISKDKLSRFEREMEVFGGKSSSVTFIVVDRLPRTGKTENAAKRIGAEIVQMSMQYWPRDLARRLGTRFGIKHKLQDLSDGEMDNYLSKKLKSIAIQEFLNNVPNILVGEVREPSAEYLLDEE